MDRFEDGGTAFPVTNERTDRGISARDYFAAAVVTGIYANRETADDSIHAIASDAYRMADAMIAARRKPPEPAPANEAADHEDEPTEQFDERWAPVGCNPNPELRGLP